MTNDLLIRSFSADLKPVRRLRSVDLRTVVWAAFALLCVSIGTCALGTRPDLAGKIRDPAFLCEGALLLALFALSARTAFQASVPGAEPTPVAKTDVDLVERTITVRHSYARDTTKGGRADVIPVAPALLPHLAGAIETSPSDLVFPASDGSMLSEDTNAERGAEVSARACWNRDRVRPHLSQVQGEGNASRGATCRRESPALPPVPDEALAMPRQVEDAVSRSPPHSGDPHAASWGGSAPRAARAAARIGDNDDGHVCAPRDRGPARCGQ